MEERAARATTRDETRQSILLWIGILVPPLAWAVHLVVAGDVAELVCLPGAAGSGRGSVYGLDIEVFVVLLTAALALVALASGAASYSCWRRLRASPAYTTGSRAQWMARAGILVSALFLLSIVIGFLPVVFLRDCMTPL